MPGAIKVMRMTAMERTRAVGIPTRQTLLERLRDWDDHEGWRDFFNTYWRLIYDVARKAGLTDSEAQDAVQETVVSVAATMPQFKYDPAKCSFKTWLQHLTHKRVADQFRKRSRETLMDDLLTASPAKGGGSRTNRLMDPAEQILDSIWEDEWRAHVIDAALESIKPRVKVRQYQMFYLHVIKNQPADVVARALSTNIGQVYLAKHRLLRLFKKAVEKVEKNS